MICARLTNRLRKFHVNKKKEEFIDFAKITKTFHKAAAQEKR